MEAGLLIVFIVMATTLANPAALRHPPAPTPLPQPAAAVRESAATSGRVIVQIAGRDKLVTVIAGPQGPVYSVTTRQGVVLANHTTLDQLEIQNPEISQYVRAALASDASIGE